MSNESIVWNYLMSNGRIANPYGVAGLMGNLYAESGINPKNLQNSGNKKFGLTDEEYTAKIDDGSITKSKFVNDSYGYGIAQWTYHTRKQKMYDYCKSHNSKSIADINSQVEFLWRELQNYTSVLKVLKNTKSIQEASDIVLTKFERPANQSSSVKKKRAEYGKTIYKKQAGLNEIKEQPVEQSSQPSQILIKPTLRKGDNGGEIKDLQKLLISLGYDLGKAGADGKFGDKTEAAVKNFQKKNELVIDGVVGKRTWAKLLE